MDKLMGYLATGYVTDRTKDAMSLAWSLNYRPKQVNEMVYMYRYTYPGYGGIAKLKLQGVCKRGNIFRWLQERHDLELVDFISDEGNA